VDQFDGLGHGSVAVSPDFLAQIGKESRISLHCPAIFGVEGFDMSIEASNSSRGIPMHRSIVILTT
jgi:hypothetical protein